MSSLIFYADNYTKLCTIEADLSGVPLLPRPKVIGQGSFYSVDCEVVILFGMTELKAQIAWMENVSCLYMFVQSNGFQINFTRGF